MHTAQKKRRRDLNYHPQCALKKRKYNLEHRWRWRQQKRLRFYSLSEYNNIIFVSLYNFSSRNLQGVQCFLRSQTFNTPKAYEIYPKEALANYSYMISLNSDEYTSRF